MCVAQVIVKGSESACLPPSSAEGEQQSLARQKEGRKEGRQHLLSLSLSLLGVSVEGRLFWMERKREHEEGRSEDELIQIFCSLSAEGRSVHESASERVSEWGREARHSVFLTCCFGHEASEEREESRADGEGDRSTSCSRGFEGRRCER